MNAPAKIQFTDAVREATNILAAFAGASGSGKTYTGLIFGTGLAGVGVDQHEQLRNAIALADSEGRRGLHYAPKRGERPARPQVEVPVLLRFDAEGRLDPKATS